jgi:Fe-Mn family superoxide dismutase
VDKRTFIKSILLGVTGIFAIGLSASLKAAKTKKKWDGIYRLPDLSFTYDALEPFMDAATLELHHSRHHAAYAEQLNTAVRKAGISDKFAYQLLKEASKYNEEICNSAGGYLNHKLFWTMLSPASGMKPSLELQQALTRDFGSFESFQADFKNASKSVFGSGWVWLITDKKGFLKITTTANHDNPIMDTMEVQGIPILCLDLWEHAYYLKSQNRRTDYVDNFWNVVNWEYVSRHYKIRNKLPF